MLTRSDVERLLGLHAKAYALLMWLDEQAQADPDLLSPQVAEALRRPRTALDWLSSNRSLLPPDLLPDHRLDGELLHLFCSFFTTSFDVKHFSFGDRLLDSRLTLGQQRGGRTGLKSAQALAIKNLGASQGFKVSEHEAGRLAERKSLQPDLAVWTYVRELDRRCRGKGKGPVAHRLWRTIPIEIRKNLDPERVWQARDKLLGAVRQQYPGQDQRGEAE
jgi:hypothetical protein